MLQALIDQNQARINRLMLMNKLLKALAEAKPCVECTTRVRQLEIYSARIFEENTGRKVEMIVAQKVPPALGSHENAMRYVNKYFEKLILILKKYGFEPEIKSKSFVHYDIVVSI